MSSSVLTNSVDITDLSALSCFLVMCFELSLEKKKVQENMALGQ